MNPRHPRPEGELTRETLGANEQGFRLLVESVKDYAIFMLDPEGRVKTWNVGAERIKGWRPDEIIGQHFSVFVPPEDREGGKCELELERAREDGRHEEEGWRVRKDGSRFWASVVLTALRSPSGELLGYAKVTRDLTVRKQAEQTWLQLLEEQVARREAEARAEERSLMVRELEGMNQLLREAVRTRDDFLTVASHELKTPLHTLSLLLSSGLRICRGADIPERLLHRLEGAQDQCERLTGLINRLLDVSRIAAGRMHLEPTELDLVEVVGAVLARDRDEIALSGCQVRLEAPASLPGRWDRLRLEQVVANLLGNALKYGERKPVSIRLSLDGSRVGIQVADQGVGIAPRDQERIFDRFERAVSSNNYAGLGLGLWITRQIIEAMGGSIRVESALGAGATFTVDLPCRLPSPPPEPPQAIVGGSEIGSLEEVAAQPAARPLQGPQ